jgi:hypothetical protein
MTRVYNPYNILQKAGAVFLIATLIWLVVSAPFILSTQQAQNDDTSITWPCGDVEDDGCDTSGNDVEEKAPAGSNLSEEFLHEHLHTSAYSTIKSGNYSRENMDVYIAFHGELHAPPPNAA